LSINSVAVVADLGESYGNYTIGDDDALLGLVTASNIACGFHAGDPARHGRHGEVLRGARH
jgi:UPF0271 protein